MTITRKRQINPLTIRIDTLWRSRLRAIAKRKGVTAHWLHRQILYQGIADLEADPEKAETPTP